jgi:predicted nucleic acid-binding protein
MSSPVCVDASFVIKLGIPETESDQVEDLWREWHHEGREIVAPHLLHYEITSVICHAVYRSRITLEEGLQVLEHLLALPIRLLTPEKLHMTAYKIAAELGQPAAYDAHYLALAQNLSCELRTGDKKLYRKVREKMPWVRVIQGA